LQDEEPEQVDLEELKTKTGQFLNSMETLKFPDSLITGEFVHDNLNEPFRDKVNAIILLEGFKAPQCSFVPNQVLFFFFIAV